MSRKGRQTRCIFILLWLLPNISGAFGLAYLDSKNHAGRLICYYLTGPYNAAFVLVCSQYSSKIHALADYGAQQILSMSTANTAGHTKKVITNAILFLGYCTGMSMTNLPSPKHKHNSPKPTSESPQSS